MPRKTLIVASVLAVLALAIPALASAAWTHKGKGELKENAAITLKGELTLSTSAGNVACPTEIGATLTASSSAGDVNSFTVSEPSKCDLTGSLAAICGTNGVTKVEKTGTWALAAEETDVKISEIDVHYVMAGCLIPSFRVKGTSTATLDKATAIGTATLSGTQTLYNALGESSGSGELKGTLTVSPAGTYGVKTAPLVEPKWTDANSPLSKDGEMTLGGTFSFSGSTGSVSCTVSAKLALAAATVEEEEPEGKVESFTVSNPSACDVGGNLKTLCGTNSVSSVEKTGTWDLTATEEDITISGIVLDYKFTSCAVTSLQLKGNATLSVSTPTEIKSATFGGSVDLNNSSGEKLEAVTLGGSPSASPSGTYALKAESHGEHTAHTEHTEHTAHTAETAHTEITEHEAHTESTGETVFPGAPLTATSSNTVFTIGGGTYLYCENVTVHGTALGKEEEPEIVTGIAGSGTMSGCAINGVVPMTVTSFNFNISLTPEGEGAGSMAFAFEFDAPLIGYNNCVDEAAAIPVNWTKGTDVLHLAGGPLLGTGAGCPAGAEAIHGTFTVETEDETPVFLSS